MASVSVYNMEGKEVGNIELSDEVFGVEINENLVHQAVLKQLADTFRSIRRRQKALEAEGNRSCPSGFNKIAPVDTRRHGIRSRSERLFHKDE